MISKSLLLNVINKHLEEFDEVDPGILSSEIVDAVYEDEGPQPTKLWAAVKVIEANMDTGDDVVGTSLPSGLYKVDLFDNETGDVRSSAFNIRESHALCDAIIELAKKLSR